MSRSSAVGPRWFQTLAWALDYPITGSIAGFTVLVGWILSNGALIISAAGIKGSPTTLLVLISIVLTILVTLGFVIRLLRWPLVYLAVKSWVAEAIRSRDLTHDTVLVGASSGGGLAVGMVGKAMQELTGTAPRVAVIDSDYVGDKFEPETARLIHLEAEFLSKHEVLYVTTYVGTGRTRYALMSALEIQGCKTFAFVVDESARDKVEFYLTSGKRRILPWPR